MFLEKQKVLLKEENDMELIIATNNAHKVKEIRAALSDNFKVHALEEVGITENIPEEQDTLEGNALQKARFIYEKYGKNCFADDTGLEVVALHGAPGVYSARYAGASCNAEDNMNKLLTELYDVTDRRAQFRTVIALIIDGKEFLFEGKVEGEILKEKRGAKGFGYDPIFRPDGYKDSFATMPLETKNSISHRGRAVRSLVAFLKEKYQ